MSEKNLNIEYICEKTLLNKDDELVPIILDLIQDSYKAGLCQAEFDNTMNLIEENQELKEKLDKYENPEDMTLFAMWCTEKVKDENEKLKKHLKVPKACNLKTLEDYKSYYEDTTREQILEDTYIEYCAYVNLAHRYSELKEQLENCYCNRTDCSGRIKDSKVYDSLVQKVETQQKEFIKYLEDVIKELQKIKETELDYDILKDVISQLLAYEEILQKHKEITQTKNNNSV